MDNISIEDKSITQHTFLWMKWKNVFNFKNEGIDYLTSDKTDKYSQFIKYSDIYNIDNFEETKYSELYYVLVWTLFLIYWILSVSLFFISASLIFLFLYYRGKQNYITLYTSAKPIFIHKDRKFEKIISEIKERRIEQLRTNLDIIKENWKGFEKNRFQWLLDESIISQDEYDKKMKEINNIKFEKQWYEKLIETLLKEKELSWEFEIRDYINENKNLPWGYSSCSWKIVFEWGDSYSFWLNWDKNILDPITKEKWYYTLWDSKAITNEYWRSFFKKLVS